MFLFLLNFHPLIFINFKSNCLYWITTWGLNPSPQVKVNLHNGLLMVSVEPVWVAVLQRGLSSNLKVPYPKNPKLLRVSSPSVDPQSVWSPSGEVQLPPGSNINNKIVYFQYRAARHVDDMLLYARFDMSVT